MKTLVRNDLPENPYRRTARRKALSGRTPDGRARTARKKHFSEKDEALKWAAAVEAEFNANGSEGLALSQDLRAQALRGEAMLAQFNKDRGAGLRILPRPPACRAEEKGERACRRFGGCMVQGQVYRHGLAAKAAQNEKTLDCHPASFGPHQARVGANRRILEITPGGRGGPSLTPSRDRDAKRTCAT